MAYFKINDVDFSNYVKQLTVAKSANYNAQTNAAGNTVIDYINSKHTLTVGFIPMSDDSMSALLTAIDDIQVNIAYRSPLTNELNQSVFIVPEQEIDYYTININGVMYNEISLEFIEL